MIPKRVEDFGLTVTINTTEDCNLRCKYCYEINKRKRSIKFEDAKKFIDIIFDDNDPVDIRNSDKGIFHENLYQSGIIFDFIGGDSLMDVDILDKIFTYITYKIWTTDSENARYWRKHHKFSISSNGTLFLEEKVRKFCEKWKNNLQVGVSLDGCPAIHDKNRIMLKRGPNGEEIGSMQFIREGWDWYRNTFPDAATSTKATLSRDSIPYITESIKYLFEELKITNIPMNFIMEDTGCTDEDYKLLDSQLRQSVIYILDHCDELYCSLFDKYMFAMHKLSTGDEWTCEGHCGSGAMPCLGINGNIYPCFRWAPHTQNKDNPEPIVVGNIKDGLNNKAGFKKVREGAYREHCTRELKCRSCIYESSCSYCIGGCYAENQDFIRTTHICEITKLQCKWAKVYWNEYNKKKGIPMEFNEFFQLNRVPAWTKEMSTVNELDC